MKALENPKAPHNQGFQINGNKTNKKSWWNPASPTYFKSEHKRKAR